MTATQREGGELVLDMKARVLDVHARCELESPNSGGVLLSSDKTSMATLAHDRRALTYQVTHGIRPLWQLESVEEFKKCYVDLLEGERYSASTCKTC